MHFGNQWRIANLKGVFIEKVSQRVASISIFREIRELEKFLKNYFNSGNVWGGWTPLSPVSQRRKLLSANLKLKYFYIKSFKQKLGRTMKIACGHVSQELFFKKDRQYVFYYSLRVNRLKFFSVYKRER